MKLIVFLHELAIGGTSVNAIELAATLRDDYGWEVILFAPPGPMQDVASKVALNWVAAPHARTHPCLPRVRALRELVIREKPDLIHVWETWALMDAYFGVHLSLRVPLLLTDMQMHVAKVLPRRLPTTFGTRLLTEEARVAGLSDASTLLPPVDLRVNQPLTHNYQEFREQLGIEAKDALVVMVSRLANQLKGDSLRMAIDAIQRLGTRSKARLLIIGDGPARGEIEAHAQAVNEILGRKAVILIGALVDPRPAYAAADIVIGMGTAALRGMAYRKPCVVVGEKGFAMTLRPETGDVFLRQGIYGVGRTQSVPYVDLAEELDRLCTAPSTWPMLGQYSLAFVRQHFSLEVIARQLHERCLAAIEVPTRNIWTWVDMLRTSSIYLRERRFSWRASPAFPTTAGSEVAVPPALLPTTRESAT